MSAATSISGVESSTNSLSFLPLFHELLLFAFNLLAARTNNPTSGWPAPRDSELSQVKASRPWNDSRNPEVGPLPFYLWLFCLLGCSGQCPSSGGTSVCTTSHSTTPLFVTVRFYVIFSWWHHAQYSISKKLQSNVIVKMN